MLTNYVECDFGDLHTKQRHRIEIYVTQAYLLDCGESYVTVA